MCWSSTNSEYSQCVGLVLTVSTQCVGLVLTEHSQCVGLALTVSTHSVLV